MGTAKDRLWQRVYQIAYRLMRIYWRAFTPTTRGAIVAVWHGGRLLLIQNSYKNEYTFPGGYRKRRECAMHAVRRELHEELHIRVSPDRLRRVGVFTSRHEFKIDSVTLFELTCNRMPGIAIDNREVVAWRFVHPAEASALHLSPFVRMYLNLQDPG
jgi:8-oxo-dGTP pyrophosphatase MutT (NUDIX family)